MAIGVASTIGQDRGGLLVALRGEFLFGLVSTLMKSGLEAQHTIY